jgi:hypothetical protein
MKRLYIVEITDENKQVTYVSTGARVTREYEEAMAMTKEEFSKFEDTLRGFYNRDFLGKNLAKDYVNVTHELIEVSRDVYTRKVMGNDHWAKPYSIKYLITECEQELKRKKIAFDEIQEEQDYSENEIYGLENKLRKLNEALVKKEETK